MMQITKHVVETDRGIVASQHRQAAQAGADVLAAGGDAVDAAVACSFVCGVLEPWMSGPAGGGGAMHWRADTGTAHALNFGMAAPAALKVADFALSGEGVAGDLFPWDRVVEDRNVIGRARRRGALRCRRPGDRTSQMGPSAMGRSASAGHPACPKRHGDRLVRRARHQQCGAGSGPRSGRGGAVSCRRHVPAIVLLDDAGQRPDRPVAPGRQPRYPGARRRRVPAWRRSRRGTGGRCPGQGRISEP